MSMNTYPMVQEAAFIIDEEVAAYIALAQDKKKNCLPISIAAFSQEEFLESARNRTLPDDYGDVEIAETLSDVCRVSSFDGELTTLFPEKTQNPISECCEDDFFYFIPSKSEVSLFSAAYTSPDELLLEYKEQFASNKIELPADFDWWRRIIKINGTTFC